MSPRAQAVAALGLAFVAGFSLMRAATDWDLFSLIAGVTFGVLVMGFVGLYDQRATA